jgi:divalent metal cation (Fe/Co/Zn/Cd) transporter
MRYISSLISGVGIFMMGAGLSWYHGIMGLLHPQPMESLLWVILLSPTLTLEYCDLVETFPYCIRGQK